MKVTRRLLTLSTLVFICALPACITGPYFPAPTILKDGANIRWAFDLERPGTLAALPTDTSPSVFMSSFDIRFGGSTVNYDAITERRLGRREELFPPETATGTVKISGRRFVPESDFFCRYYFVVENTGAAPVTDDIVVYIVPHAGANFNVVNTADGDGFVEAGENWLVASLATPATADDLSTALVWGDETSTLAPAVGLTPTDVTLTFSGVTIPAGSSITFVLYGIAHKSTTVLAGQAARISAGLAPQCAVGFSAAEMAQIRNFTFDSDGDGMGDGWEMAYTYTVGVNDGAADKDADQIPGWQEFMLNANPIVQDSDNDKLSDRDEFYTHGTDLATKDSDGDRVTDRFEVTVGKNPLDGSDGAFRYFSGSNNWATQPSIAFDATFGTL